MFVPFVFTLDDFYIRYENYFDWMFFYLYSDACIKNKWPIISHERYFKRFCNIEETVYGIPIRDLFFTSFLNDLTTEAMLALKSYPIPEKDESDLIAKYPSQLDCWIDLLKNENLEFENIIGKALDKIITDFGEKPEAILAWERIPKALQSAADKRGIPVVFQGLSILRPPLVPILNAFSLINGNNAKLVKARYDKFMLENEGIPMFTRKGILRLLVSEQYQIDIHNIDKEPEYDVGILYNNANTAYQYIDDNYLSDQEMSIHAREKYTKILIRTRPLYEPTADALDDSPTCFHFCCKCRRVLGLRTKGMFEAMLAGRIAHEYGSFFFHSFCNDGIEDGSKGVAPVEFINFVLFGMCTPFTWLTKPDYLRFLLSNPSEKEIYMCSFEHYTRNISREDLEFYYMSDNRIYRLGDLLYFSSGHKPHEYAAYYTTDGLCKPWGNDCTWSNGEYTSFEFDLAEPVNEPLLILVGLHDVAMDWSSPNPSQTVICEVNGTNCGSVMLVPGKKHFKFLIPVECFKDKLRIKFLYSYLHNTEQGIKLAIAFESMRIYRNGQQAIEDVLSDEIISLEGNIKNLKENITGLEGYIKGLEENKRYLEGNVTVLKENITNLERKNEGLENNIKSIYNSRSWKLGNGIIKLAKKIILRKK